MTRWRGPLAALVALAGPLSAQTADARAFVQVAVDRGAVFVGTPLRVTLRVGIDRGFLAENVIQPFRQQLDVPVRVESPWAAELAGATWRDVAADGRTATFVLDDALGHARVAGDRDVDGRAFTVLEVVREVVPQRVGALSIPAPRLRIAYATRFRDDFLNGRVPEDRSDLDVDGEPVVVRVDALPAAGRPAGFDGAIGRFALAASTDVATVELGASFRLELRITGDGDLGALEPPRLDGLDGFHALGRIDRVDGDARVAVYELVPLRADLTAVPPIELVSFDPTPPGGYVTARSAPVPLRVTPSAGGQRAVEQLAPPADEPPATSESLADLLPLGDAAPRDSVGRPSNALVVAALLGPWGLALLVALWRRLAASRRVDAGVLRARRAVAELRARLADGRRDPGAVLVEFVAARLGCSPAAAIGPDLDARLRSAGIDAALAERTAGLVRALIAARYGGDAVDGADAAVADLATALEGAFRSEEVAA